MTPNRIVALITPACALAAGWAASWLARHVPGLDIPQEHLQTVFIAGGAAVLAPALQWLYGWQKWEARNDLALAAAAQGFPEATPIVMPVDDGGAVEDGAVEDGAFEVADDEDVDEFDDLVDFEDLEDTSVTDEEEEPVLAGS
jgi:hypothetical protein